MALIHPPLAGRISVSPGTLDSAVQDGWYHEKYEYNAFGKPVKISLAEGSNPYVVSRYLLWDGDALAGEFDANGQRMVDYAYLPGTIDRPFAHTLGATTPTAVRYPEIDELANVVGTSESGNLSQINSYDGWGTVTVGGNADQHLFWKGLFWDGTLTGLYYVRNRWYDPEAGRFMSEDPAGFVGGINLYSFAANDPINGSDPSGLCIIPEDFFQTIAASEEGEWSYNCTDLPPVVVGANEPPLPGPLGGTGPVSDPSNHGGGGGGGTSSNTPAKPGGHFWACAGAIANAGVTAIGDLAFFTGIGEGAKLGILGWRERRLAIMFVRDAVRGIAHSSNARALFGNAGRALGVAVAERFGMGIIQPDNAAQASWDPEPWRSFIPGIATKDAIVSAINCRSN